MSQAQPSKMEAFLESRDRAERGDLVVCVGALIAAVVLLVSAGLLVAPINKMRVEQQIILPLNERTLADLPPDIALLTKTGTLRALAIDLAFIRMEELKQSNRFYELMQLSKWLCDLAPRYARVWQYSAWNMAYNISVCEYTPEARWLWVKNGINNLRQQGLVYNPRSITLYRELSWIFYHKVGDKLDDYHMQYKRELAVEMELLLGEPALAVSTEDAIAAIRRIAEAPDDVAAWIESTPQAQDLVADLAAVQLSPDKGLLHFVAQHVRVYTNVAEFVAAEDATEAQRFLAAQRALLTDETRAETVQTLLAALRKQVLRDDYNMRADMMLSIMENPIWLEGEEDHHLPVDWRLPFAHSLYWSILGDMTCAGTLNIDDADSMNTVRMIFFSLSNLIRGGQVVLEPDFEKPNRSFMQMLPDARFIKPMHYAYLYFGQIQFGNDPRFVPGTCGPNYASGHRNFLRDSIRFLYLEGGDRNIDEAKEYFFYLRNFDREADGTVKAQYMGTFDEFILASIQDSIDTQNGATVFIAGLLERHLKEAALGQRARSIRHYREAKQWWDYYSRDLKTDRNTRRKLEPLPIIRRDVARQMLSVAAGQYSATGKARIWKALDTATRRAIYDDILPYMRQFCEDHVPPLAVDKLIPIPPGMDEYRENPDEVLKELERYDPNVSQGAKVLVE